ncbi:unnamed protein product, partial [Discosporangium mesarthrocarpum]
MVYKKRNELLFAVHGSPYPAAPFSNPPPVCQTWGRAPNFLHCRRVDWPLPWGLGFEHHQCCDNMLQHITYPCMCSSCPNKNLNQPARQWIISLPPPGLPPVPIPPLHLRPATPPGCDLAWHDIP